MVREACAGLNLFVAHVEYRLQATCLLPSMVLITERFLGSQYRAQ